MFGLRNKKIKFSVHTLNLSPSFLPKCSDNKARTNSVSPFQIAQSGFTLFAILSPLVRILRWANVDPLNTYKRATFGLPAKRHWSEIECMLWRYKMSSGIEY